MNAIGSDHDQQQLTCHYIIRARKVMPKSLHESTNTMHAFLSFQRHMHPHDHPIAHARKYKHK